MEPVRNRIPWKPTLVALVLAIPLAWTVFATAESEPGASPGEAAKPGPPSGFIIVTHNVGKIGCAAGALDVVTPDLCERGAIHPANPGIDPSARTSFGLQAPAGTTGIVLELAWHRTSALGAERLRLSVDDCLAPHNCGPFEGASPLRVVIDPVSHVITHNGLQSRLHVGAAGNGGLVVDQPFELYATVFVGLPVPDGYTAIQD